jgi:protein arginine kinase activator
LTAGTADRTLFLGGTFGRLPGAWSVDFGTGSSVEDDLTNGWPPGDRRRCQQSPDFRDFRRLGEYRKGGLVFPTRGSIFLMRSSLADAGDVFNMQCEVCQNAVATVHLTDVSNNMKKEIHLCEECAKKRGTTIKSHMNKEPNYPEFKTAHLVAGEFSEPGSEETDLVCPSCGITYSKFRSTGKFGCPEDYKIFGQHVIQLLEKIHHKVQHVGKSPKCAVADDELSGEVDELRDALNNAIALEQYEKAAAIRDKIYGLEGRIASPD